MTASAPVATDARCPCCSGDLYGLCCGPAHSGTRPAPTAEALMRSRFSAFAVGDADYLRASWHVSTRPAELDLDPDLEWWRLDILGTTAGGPFDDAGTVEFVAHYRDPAVAGREGRGKMQELSRFVREGGRWYYVDAAG
ncbi:SEC-C motif-containing protein [Paraoerskovia marina]|uniref:UPF0225 protein SAMN04489860_0594 n=1 Tax=Paraoerskovia marina TaxID=545619 RepID=A0A1H1NQE3_9CELL|nr:YchJ family protein [Paraoerskovia marina]SDS01217.1 SEC-C motif-containing protein [Paraoerskovia marina]